MPEKVTKRIRGLDAELYRKAKAAAAAQGKPMGEWISEAIAEKLTNAARAFHYKVQKRLKGEEPELIQTYCPICHRINGEHDEGCPNA